MGDFHPIGSAVAEMLNEYFLFEVTMILNNNVSIFDLSPPDVPGPKKVG